MAQSTAVIETGRLLLRPFDRNDVDELHAVLGDAEAMTYYPAAFSIKETETWVRSNIERYERDGTGLWAIEDRATGEFLGDCGLVHQVVDGEDESRWAGT